MVPMLISFTKQVVHPLCIFRTALLGIEEPEIVEGGESGCVSRSQCLLKTGQCTVVHSLCVFEMALIGVEEP